MNGNEKPKKRLLFTLEDEECIEGWPLPAIVPLVFSEYKGRIEAECYFGVYEEARSFLLEHAEDLFSRAALDDLNALFAPYLEARGYERGYGVYRYYRSFVLWKREQLNDRAIRDDSAMLDRSVLGTVAKNRTGFDLSELLDKKLPAAVTVKNGELLSIATVNEHGRGQRLLEAAVYTLPAHRGKGYGRSNTALLCKTLLEKKKGVVYCCSCRNRASLKIAKDLGFTSESRFYAIDAYRTQK